MTTIREILADQPNRGTSDKFVLVSIRVKDASERNTVEQWLNGKVLEAVQGPIAAPISSFVHDTGKGRING
jgi:hypothetical protein